MQIQGFTVEYEFWQYSTALYQDVDDKCIW